LISAIFKRRKVARSQPAGPRRGREPAAGSLTAVRIGLNLVFLTPGESGGMEIYARELIPALVAAAPEHRFTAFVNRDGAAAEGPWGELIPTVTVPVRARNRFEWVRGEQLVLPRLAARADVELLHSLASTAPATGRFRRVVTIHDLIYRTMPEAHPGLRSVGMRVLVPLAARRSDRVIVDSAATRADVLRHLGTPAAKVDVVPLGLGALRRTGPIGEDELRRSLKAGERSIVLSVSAKLAHKNLQRLIEALGLIPAVERPLLVLPGYATPHEEVLKRRAAELSVADDVRFLGWVSAPELEGLYAAARAVVLPSLAEGFGLPVLEAMARGVPVACSGRGALAEVAGDAALTFDPESVPAIAAALRRLVTDDALSGRLRAAGPAHAAAFRWEATAALTLASYERALCA
jgi:glycosyltransferase involved in cell wall biosynthesis